MENQNWNDWKFLIHWSKIEWENPSIRIEQNNTFCVSSKIFCLEDNNKTTHWVGHSKLKPHDIEDTFKINKVIIYLQAIWNGNTIEQSYSGRKNNPYESEEQESKEVDADADVTSYASKIDEDDDKIIIPV